MRRLWPGGRGSRGQTLVEFAITLPIIVLIVLGLVDLGRGVFTYNTLAQSARQATRLAIVDQDASRVKTQAIAYAATLGLTASSVDVCFKTYDSTQSDCSSNTNNCPEATREIGCLAIVKAHVSYQPMTPFISTIFSSISLSSTSIQSIEYVCPSGTKTTCP